MFNQGKDKEGVREAETIIGPSIVVKGNFHGKGNIIIEGSVEGSVKTDQSLYVGDNAKIMADIEANEARIGGVISGNIKVSGYLDIASSAQITGDIEAESLSIAKGAIFNGSCKMGPGAANTQKMEE